MDDFDKIREGIAALIRVAHGDAVKAGWHSNIRTGEPVDRNVGECLMLIVSEVSEGMEGHRKNKADDHLPHRKSLEVELGDAIIRVADLSGKLGLDLPGAIVEKIIYNRSRADHRPENRAKEGGKAF